ncbi:hypothetical protein CQ054_16960 [Ochrobactrum sp. MYb29]|uniref:hypothetical protein n=1 Tax=Brucella pituitosa TaxID=571256 RepID=UPI000C2769B2|nr:hypothetical protein [Brucella pituitosa]PJO49701.1 hypothetical protein CWE02_08170 [Brucella pituitosa]PRA84377.1 hypothetical protein CQ054_16960 [Ochrobactrum sp. MYb29]
MINVRKWSCGIAFGLSLTPLLFSQALAASSNSGDLSAEQRAELQRSAGISCDANGNDDCTAGNVESGDYYNVRIYGDCANAAYFGRISDKAVSLRKDVATTGTEGKTNGPLAPEQLVCIKAAAQVNVTDKEYYVMALPMDHGPECKGEELCRKPRSLPENYQKTMANCQPDSQNDYRGCPQGWVFATEMEAYSNGLPGAQ